MSKKDTTNKGPVKPDEKKKATDLKEAIRVVAEIFYSSDRVEVEYDFTEVIELKLKKSGRFVRCTLEEISDPRAEAEEY